MAYDVILDPRAVDRLDEIVTYLSEVLVSPSAAGSFLDSFDELIGNLETLPLAYPSAHDERLAARAYRKALVGKYVVLFRVAETGGHNGTVYVTNIFHGTQDSPGLV